MQILTYLVIRFMGDIREQISSGRTSWTSDTWKNEKLFVKLHKRRTEQEKDHIFHCFSFRLI